MKLKRTKWRIVLMTILIQVHQMNLIINLIDLIMENLMVILLIMNLKDKTIKKKKK